MRKYAVRAKNTDCTCQRHTASCRQNITRALENPHAAPAASFLRRQESICIAVKESFVYLLASQKHGTLYLGVTSNLIRRVYEHREGLAAGFTAAYGVRSLVWYEVHGDIREAIRREKQIKKWKRQWKIRLIEEMNPEWKDLYDELV